MRLTLIAAVAMFANPAFAYELKTDPTGADVRWAHAVHFTIDAQLEALLEAPHAIDAVKESIATWKSTGIDVTADVGDVSGVDNIITAVTSNWPYDANTMAVTVLTLDTTNHTIMKANVYLNAVANKFQVLAADSKRGGGYVDVQNTVTHELGHAFGLAHVQDHPEAVMYPMAYNGDIDKRTLKADDLAGLDVLYPAGLAMTDGAAQVGCSVTGSPTLVFGMLGMLALSLRGRSVVAVRSVKASFQTWRSSQAV